MMRRIVLGFLACFALALMTGCGQAAPLQVDTPQQTSTTPLTTATATPQIPGVPTGWQVYSGQHFHIASPSTWNATTSRAETGLLGGGLILTDASANPPTSGISVGETWGYSAADTPKLCQIEGTTVVVAGLSMKYMVGEGVRRDWFYVDSHHVSYMIDVIDFNQPKSVQQRDDAVIATFSPDDTTPGCAWK